MEEIMVVEGYDWKDKMIFERQEWIREQKRINGGKIPANLDEFNAMKLA